MKHLPDGLFEIMDAVWKLDAPVTALQVLQQIGEGRMKIQTVISWLSRLADKGFIRSEKEKGQRLYYPLVKREDYVQFETDLLIKKYYGNSISALFSALYDGKQIGASEKELVQQNKDEDGE